MKPRGGEGALVGGLATLAFAAVSFLGWKLAGLAFTPFDLFDWAVRAVPGPVATAGIDSFIALTRAFPAGSSAVVAKTAEQTLAVVLFVAAGTAVAAALYAVLSQTDEPALLAGVLCGAILSGTAIVAEYALNRIGPAPSPDHIWLTGLGLAWGTSIGWTYDHLGRAGRLSPDGGGRRTFLIRLASATFAATGLSTMLAVLSGKRRMSFGGERWSASHPLPNASAAVVPVPGTRPEFTPLESHYRIDADTRAPAIDAARWRLKVGGLVDRALELTTQDLQSIEPTHQFVTLSCVSNPVAGDLIGTTRWTGASLQRLLPRFGLQPTATHLRLVSADGFFEVISLETVRTDARVMLAYAWDGLPLSIEHGFPLRIYIPDVYGMKQPKWIQSIEAIARWEPGYWVARGWDRAGRMKATSAIDAIVVDREADGTGRRVLVGGIAHAGVRGVSKVEVQVDDGEWSEAELREPLSEAAWAIWRWRSVPTLEPGARTLTVRCFERDGTPQGAERHAKRFTL